MLPISAFIEEWQLKQSVFEDESIDFGGALESSPGVKAVHRCRGWIPIAWSQSGDTICVDLSPQVKGLVGR